MHTSSVKKTWIFPCWKWNMLQGKCADQNSVLTQTDQGRSTSKWYRLLCHWELLNGPGVRVSKLPYSDRKAGNTRELPPPTAHYQWNRSQNPPVRARSKKEEMLLSMISIGKWSREKSFLLSQWVREWKLRPVVTVGGRGKTFSLPSCLVKLL